MKVNVAKYSYFFPNFCLVVNFSYTVNLNSEEDIDCASMYRGELHCQWRLWIFEPKAHSKCCLLHGTLNDYFMSIRARGQLSHQRATPTKQMRLLAENKGCSHADDALTPCGGRWCEKGIWHKRKTELSTSFNSWFLLVVHGNPCVSQYGTFMSMIWLPLRERGQGDANASWLHNQCVNAAPQPASTRCDGRHLQCGNAQVCMGNSSFIL